MSGGCRECGEYTMGSICAPCLAGENQDAPTSAITLDTLAVEIRRQVEAADADFQNAVAHAIRAGELLLEAKATVEHGAWIPWLEVNFAFTRQTATGYMRLAKHADHMEGAPSISAALKQIAPPKVEPTPDADEPRAQAKTTMCQRCESRVRTDRPHKCQETHRQLEEAHKALKRAYADASGYPGAVADLNECLALAERCSDLAGRVRAEVGGRYLDDQQRIKRTADAVGFAVCDCGSRIADYKGRPYCYGCASYRDGRSA